MATTISGTLINGIGEPIKNCKITLKSISTSTTVIAHTTASQTPSAAGDYSMSVEPGKYKVTLCVDGFPPEYVGDIQVYKDSPNGTLNYFLGLPQDNDLRPDAIKHFEAMVDKVASQVAEVEKSKLAAEASARSAAASADRASQITGLSTVTDAISMASVPLPDVWIPLNDGLQMLAGYGEEVKVGEIVVARMLKYDRAGVAYYTDKGGNLRRADANAPRFEKNGLLLEGQATNLISNSSTITTKYQYTDTGKTVSTPMNDGSNAVIYTAEAEGSTGFLRFGSAIKTMSDLTETRTSSCWVLSPDEDTDINIECEGKNAITFNVKAGVWTRISSTRTQAVASGGYINFFDVLIKNPRIGQKIVVWGGQLESSTAMTSYIHTTGTQLTRPQDFATIPYYKNACEDMSVAVEITAGAYTPPYSNWIIDFASNSNNERYALSYNNSDEIYANGFGLGASGVSGFNLNERAVVVAVWRALDKKISIYLNGKRGQVSTGTQLPVVASHGLIRLMRSYAGVASNGNVRNLRIWHKALTEEQARAIR
ncbi:prophage tail fiber N-terminal domain-containing protein [Edwardsiella tarda]|uniref:prophage tail fiber N-terminal domain-containing protein n=1 Tax=Edwardsiella tarda TaxID=636 RepID=UPI00351CA09C